MRTSPHLARALSRVLRLLGLLAMLWPQLARAQTPPAKGAPAAPPETKQEAPPVAPPAPPEAFPQAAEQPAPPPGQAPIAPPPSAYPYGYGYGGGYAQPPLDPGREKALGELQSVELRLASLRKQQKQHSLVAPIAMTGAGYGVAAVAGFVAVFEWLIADDIRNDRCGYVYSRSRRDYDDICDVDNDGEVDKQDERDARMMARAFGALSALGGGLGIAGTVLLVKRLAKRRQYSPELDELGARRGRLLQQLRYGGSFSHNGLQLSLSGRF